MVPHNPGLSGGAQALHELLRMFNATRESQDIERKRRLAWEQEQEAKFTQRQAEMERQMLEMRQELVSLKTSIGLNSDTGHGAAMVVQQPTPQTSQSPVSTSSLSHVQLAFVEGSSSRPFHPHAPTNAQSHSPDFMAVEPPSPQFIAVEGSRLHPDAPSPPANMRKRPTPDPPSDEDDESSESDSHSQRNLRRTSGHDSRCLTVQVCLNFLCIVGIDKTINAYSTQYGHTSSAPCKSKAINYYRIATSRAHLYFRPSPSALSGTRPQNSPSTTAG